jgi:hypothetical protein
MLQEDVHIAEDTDCDYDASPCQADKELSTSFVIVVAGLYLSSEKRRDVHDVVQEWKHVA